MCSRSKNLTTHRCLTVSFSTNLTHWTYVDPLAVYSINGLDTCVSFVIGPPKSFVYKAILLSKDCLF